MISDDRFRQIEGASYEEEVLPAAARPQWGTVEKILIGSILALAVVSLWVGFSWGSVHG